MKYTDEVFGIAPTVSNYSYVDRGDLDKELRKYLRRSTHIALRGESKCGKSWLRQKIIPNALVVQCRHKKSIYDIYADALSQLDIKLTVSNSTTTSFKGRLEAEGSAGAGLLENIFGLSVKGKTTGETTREASQNLESIGKDINDLRHIAEILIASRRRLVIEDFHYLSIEERKAFSFDLKALWDYKLFVLLIGVWSRSNMLPSLNPDLNGRVEEIPIFWKPTDLKKILAKGGKALNLRFSTEFQNQCATNAYGNAGILQTLALRSLDNLSINEGNYSYFSASGRVGAACPTPLRSLTRKRSRRCACFSGPPV